MPVNLSDYFFNSKARSRGESKTGQTRHVKAREPPLPLFIGFNVHAMTRRKTLISKFYQLGLSVSYQRIVELEDMLATSVSERFAVDDCVVPACLRSGIFTIGALDNLDHNPSSTTASSSFHGTGISVFQLPTAHSPGEKRPPLILPPNGTGHALPILRNMPLLTRLSLTPPTCLCQSARQKRSRNRV